MVHGQSRLKIQCGHGYIAARQQPRQPNESCDTNEAARALPERALPGTYCIAKVLDPLDGLAIKGLSRVKSSTLLAISSSLRAAFSGSEYWQSVAYFIAPSSLEPAAAANA